MINENISYAKSILNKKGINIDSDEYKDYLKIRDICGSNHGYVGILTKIRYIDEVDDMDEIESIFDILKDSKIEIGKLNRMSYNDILDIFYNELNVSNKEDIELIYKDNTYSYFRVYTYKGILDISSPAWCLKTKSHWDNYQKEYPDQWVVILNENLKNIITPNNNYLESYKSNKSYIRYGISAKYENGILNYICFNDNNVSIKHHDNGRLFNIITTIKNYYNGNNNISYYKSQIGCTHIDKGIFKVNDIEYINKTFNLKDNYLNNDYDNVFYLMTSDNYHIPSILSMNNNFSYSFFPTLSDKECDQVINISGNISKGLLLEYTKYLLKENYDKASSYLGIALKNNLITKEEIISANSYIGEFNDYIILWNSEKYYQIINKNSDNKDLQIPLYTLGKKFFELENPINFYINKEDYSLFNMGSNDITNGIINYIMEKEQEEIDKEKRDNPKKDNPKKVSGFFDFFKKKK